MNLYEAMDMVRDQISAIDGRLSTLSYREINELLESLEVTTGLVEELLRWRLRVVKELVEQEAQEQDNQEEYNQ